MARSGSLRFPDRFNIRAQLFALGRILFDGRTKLGFLRLPIVFAERKKPEWTQVDSGITFVDSTMVLDFELLVLIEHLPPLL